MKTSILSLLACTALGCGSSVEPEQHKQDPIPVVPETPPAAPKRSLINRPLLAGSSQNLLLDIGFRDAGWGHFTTIMGAGLAQVTSRTFSLAPASVTAPVGLFKDPTADDEKSKSMISICSFLGGKGPFMARVWVSRSNVAGDPIELVDDPTVFRAALTTGGSPEGKAYVLARKEDLVLGKRTWTLYEAKVEADLPSTAFFNLSFGRKGGAYMVTAPEVVALNLLPPGDSAMSASLAAKVTSVTPEESMALAIYRKQPHPLGLPKPTSAKVIVE